MVNFIIVFIQKIKLKIFFLLQVKVMYQTSLKQFLGVFDSSMTKAPRNSITSKRILNIIDTLTLEVWKYTGRDLYEKYKMLYILLTALKIDLQSGNIKSSEFQISIKGSAEI